MQMRKAAEAVYGAINDKIAPGHACVELVFEQIEESHVEAVPLTRVVCVEDGELMATGAFVDAGGVVRIRRGRQDVAAPGDPEALRRRLRTWGFAYTYARLKHPGRAWLADALPEAVADYADWLLGDQVRGLEAKDESGATISRPPWALVMKYESEVRKMQAKKINEGASYRTALKEAMADIALRDRQFITPLAIGSSSNTGGRPRCYDRSRSPGGKGSKGKRAFGKGGLCPRPRQRARGHRQRPGRLAGDHARWKADLLRVQRRQGALQREVRKSSRVQALPRQPSGPCLPATARRGPSAARRGCPLQGPTPIPPSGLSSEGKN